MEKHKFASISLTVQDSDFVKMFDPQGIWHVYSWQFSKDFTLLKNGGYFEFLPKMENANLLLSL